MLRPRTLTHSSPKPFLHWPGGKHQLLSQIRKHIPRNISTYYEPFLGAGSVLFDLNPDVFVVSDLNEELINAYQVVKCHFNPLLRKLSNYPNSESFYYYLRNLDRLPIFQKLSPIERAARMIYLNKTCYSGLFRVNRKAQINSPYGFRKSPEIVDAITLKAVSKFFRRKNNKLLSVDFEQAIKEPHHNAFAYFDPPYDPVSKTSSFTAYTKQGFDRTEQVRLKLFCDKLNQQGIRFLLSNSSTEFVKNLYSNYRLETVQAKRSILSPNQKQSKIDEVLIRNYE